jgi:hypothetical protein
MTEQQPVAPATTPPDKVPEAAIQDIARYQEPLLKMILHHDHRSLRILAQYVTIIGALLTAAFALNQAHALNAYAAILMGGAAGRNMISFDLLPRP